MEAINVTKTFLPPLNEYEAYVARIWQKGQLTNQGPLVREFEKRTSEYLGVDNFQFVTNGTLALQLAIRALNITGSEIITTPFSYVATSSAILWENCRPVYVDIDPETYCIDPKKIEAAITTETKAILAVHVFGNPCDIDTIEAIAKKHKLKVIYDGAHAFGVTYRGKSLLSYGDVSITSFHATKSFHTIEGGGLIVKNKSVAERVELQKRFGHNQDDHCMLGINAKASEFHAAMGLCNLNYIDDITASRKHNAKYYDGLLSNQLQKQKVSDDIAHNYSYYPVLFKDEKQLLVAKSQLEKASIFPRRYFYPSLNELPYLSEKQSCPISEDISARILCLPLYATLDNKDISRICNIINKLVEE